MTINTTLLDLVATVSEFTDTENELVAVVVRLVNSGRVMLIGNFKGARFDLQALTASASGLDREGAAARWDAEGR